MHHDMAVPARWRCRHAGEFLLFATLLSAAGGCLSLGGRTTYVQASPETDARIRGLETRVTALEQAFATRSGSGPALSYGAGEPMVSQSNPPRPPLGSPPPARR